MHDNNTIKAQIVHLLEVYPILSPTLLQNLLGSRVKAAVWKPVLEELIEEGKVRRGTIACNNVFGQFRHYTRITLTDNGQRQLDCVNNS